MAKSEPDRSLKTEEFFFDTDASLFDGRHLQMSSYDFNNVFNSRDSHMDQINTFLKNVQVLLEAARFLESADRKDGKCEHGYASTFGSDLNSNYHRQRRFRNKFSSNHNRSTHNELEKNRNRLEKITKVCSEIIGFPTGSLSSIYEQQTLRLASIILQDSTLSPRSSFEWLPTQRNLRCPGYRTQRRKAAFVPKAENLLNSCRISLQVLCLPVTAYLFIFNLVIFTLLTLFITTHNAATI
ncbi:max-interacting protein 1 isoform X2 [Antennarius striatus]|uniref:max-interacting protein 1 isoform X2 n=1 Tax=Antennarius striatus TaxID=241820 RepID=UPI0035AF02B1